MRDEQGMKPFAELEREYAEWRLAGCIARLTGKAAGRRVRDRARLRQDLDYWTEALERHRAGRDHEGVERIRKEYANRMRTAVRHGLPVSKAVSVPPDRISWNDTRIRAHAPEYGVLLDAAAV